MDYFISILTAVIGIFGYGVYRLFRPGGIYNPHLKPPVQPVKLPISDVPPVVVLDIPPPNQLLKYDWSTPEKAKHSVRVVCDEEGLTVEQKNTLCATIGGESGWTTGAINRNYAFKIKKDANGNSVIGEDGKPVMVRYLASTDFGICQWNDYYHGDEISPEEAVNNPEKAVRLMCKYWKMGEKYRQWWIAYKNGSYKRYL